MNFNVKKSIVGMAMLSVVFLTMPCEPGYAAVQKLKVGTLAPRGSFFHRLLEELGQQWREVEGEAARFVVYPDGSQGGEQDMVRRMRIGQLNAALITVVGLTEIDPSVGALQKIPLLFRNWEEVDEAGRELRERLQQSLNKKGFRALFWGDAGWVRFFSKDALMTPDDFKKSRIFAWSGDPEQVENMKTLGFRPIVLETADMLPGLQSGLVNVVPVTPIFALISQIDAIAPHMLDIKWAPIVGAFVIREETWKELSDRGRAALRSAAEKAEAKIKENRDRRDERAIEAMRLRGLNVHDPDDEQLRAWREFADSTYPLVRGRTVPADVFDQVYTLIYGPGEGK
ncbi:MAG: TRAP transporter substrate-binding protein [Gammaproteobacteria bacterium]